MAFKALGRQRPFVLVPLYIYPSATSWDPLFTAARSHVGVEFVVIVNPNNGPGRSPRPNEDYMSALQELSSLPNVKVLGYVHCSYGKRAITKLEDDVRIYQGWTGLQPNSDNSELSLGQPIRIDGIFFDEAPADVAHVNYMTTISDAVRAATQDGESNPHPPQLVIYNPGIFVDPRFYEAADYIAVFENTTAEWNSDYVRTNLKRLSEELRKRSIAIAHTGGSLEEQLHFGKDVISDAGFVGHFATAIPGYTQWCPNWEAYVRHADEAWADMQQDTM